MVKASSMTYEEVRKKRLEENKKRMEELNLTTLAQAVRNASSTKPSSMKKVKPRSAHKETVPTEVRRSARVSNLPAPVYKEVMIHSAHEETVLTDVRRSARLSTVPAPVYKEDSFDDIESPRRYSIHAADEDRISAIERAEELESKLESEFPSFVRPMLPSHLTGSFWLGLPSQFCNKNLPKRDETITLIDENEDEWQTIYIATRTGLSDGWREFALDHKLVDGDVLVFELIKPTGFKVYVVKVNS
ncbi:hypothetical protein ACHQM5_025310 [Ranunculus cassubicifolius]